MRREKRRAHDSLAFSVRPLVKLDKVARWRLFTVAPPRNESCLSGNKEIKLGILFQKKENLAIFTLHVKRTQISWAGCTDVV